MEDIMVLLISLSVLAYLACTVLVRLILKLFEDRGDKADEVFAFFATILAPVALTLFIVLVIFIGICKVYVKIVDGYLYPGFKTLFKNLVDKFLC